MPRKYTKKKNKKGGTPPKTISNRKNIIYVYWSIPYKIRSITYIMLSVLILCIIVYSIDYIKYYQHDKFD